MPGRATSRHHAAPANAPGPGLETGPSPGLGWAGPGLETDWSGRGREDALEAEVLGCLKSVRTRCAADCSKERTRRRRGALRVASVPWRTAAACCSQSAAAEYAGAYATKARGGAVLK